MIAAVHQRAADHILERFEIFGSMVPWFHGSISKCLATAPVFLFRATRHFVLFSCEFKVTRPSFFGGAPSYFEDLWYPHLYFYRKSNT